MALKSFYDIPIVQVDGIETTFIFSILKPDSETKSYLRDVDIVVYERVAGVLVVTSQEYILGTSSVIFTSAPTTSTEFRVQRESPRDELFATFSRGTNFTKDEVKNTYLNLLYSLQEIEDTILKSSGKWVPTIITSDGGQTQSSNVQGDWSKVGDVTTVIFRALLTAKGSSTLAVRLGGLPFNIKSLTNYQVYSTVGTQNINWSVFGTGVPVILCNSGNDYGELFNAVNNSTLVAVTNGSGIMSNTSEISGSFTYRANDNVLNDNATLD